ncbi:hypothetical protein WN943_022246 [Citrus x changshan-huyou]
MYNDETSCVKQGVALLVGGGLARYPGSEVCCLLSRRPLARDHGTSRKFSSSRQKAFPARAKVGGPSPWKLLERAPLSESSGMNPIQPQPQRSNVYYGELWGVVNVNRGGRIFRRAIKGAIEKGDSLDESCSPEEVSRCIHVGLLCVQDKAMDRPTMSDVSMLTNRTMALPTPKQTTFFINISSDYQEPEVTEIKLEICSVNDVTISGMEGR